MRFGTSPPRRSGGTLVSRGRCSTDFTTHHETICGQANDSVACMRLQARNRPMLGLCVAHRDLEWTNRGTFHLRITILWLVYFGFDKADHQPITSYTHRCFACTDAPVTRMGAILPVGAAHIHEGHQEYLGVQRVSNRASCLHSPRSSVLQ